MAKVYKGITKDYTPAEYEELRKEGAAALRAEGFIHDPIVVYECVEDKVPAFDGSKQYTLEAYSVDAETKEPKDKIPVGTKIHGMEETHFNWDNVPLK